MGILPSRQQTLIVTDLVFNMKDCSFFTKFVLRAVGAHGKLAQSRLVKLMIDDKDAFTESIRSLAQMEAQSLIMAHGSILNQASNWSEFFRDYEI